MSTSNALPKKTTVNRTLLFFLIGFSISTPLLIFDFIWGSGWSFLLLPLVVLAVLLFMIRREKRISEAKPGWMEFFLSFLGAFYPSVLAAILLWGVWWVSFGIIGFVAGNWDIDGDAYKSAYSVYGFFSLGSAIFLVRMNWKHLVSQLYPQVGSQSAFAQISKSGKLWLKRVIRKFFIFVILLGVTIIIVGFLLSPGGKNTLGDEFLIGLFFILIYGFFISISAWLWLRKPEMPQGVAVANKAIARMLKPLGYDVRTINEVKIEPRLEVEISDSMIASVDIIASSGDASLVIDVMTPIETTKSPDWITASEFRMASLYLKKVLQLPSPVNAFLVLVDVIPDESFYIFAESHDIKITQVSGEEMVNLLKPGISDRVYQELAARYFVPLSTKSMQLHSMVPRLVNGGRNG